MALTLLSLCCIQAGSSSWGSLRMSHTSSAAWVEALSGMIYFHHTFHLPKRQQGQEAQASPCWFFISAPALPSVLIPVLGIAQSCSCCWGELEPTPAHRFPHVFPGHFLWKMMLLVHSSPSVNSAFAVCQTQSSQKPVISFALISCALDWAHCGLLQDNNSQFLIRKMEIQQTKCRTSLYAAKSGKMSWSLWKQLQQWDRKFKESYSKQQCTMEK